MYIAAESGPLCWLWSQEIYQGAFRTTSIDIVALAGMNKLLIIELSERNKENVYMIVFHVSREARTFWDNHL